MVGATTAWKEFLKDCIKYGGEYMKRYIVLILTAFLILGLFSSCRDNDFEKETSSQLLEYQTLDSLIDAIQQSRQKQKDGVDLSKEDLILVGLETLPYPTADFLNQYRLKPQKI